MGLTGKLICQTAIKSDGDVFHEIFSTRPHQVQTMTPDNIQGCDLQEGEFGQVGSIVIWKYFIDGKAMIAKERIEAIDEEEKSVTYKVVEGDLLESFKIFVISVHVDTKGGNNLVTWSFEYEKVDESVKDPTTYLDLVLRMTRDIEAYHLSKVPALLTGKLVSKTKIVSDGDVFHQLLLTKPHDLSNISPAKVQGCDLHEGAFGKVGSIICWRYVHEGKKKIGKEVIEAIDEENKSITFKMLEGDLMELYKSFIISVHVDTKGEDNLVTWTFDYEKLHEDVEDPNSLMEFFIHLTKDIESHHLQ